MIKEYVWLCPRESQSPDMYLHLLLWRLKLWNFSIPYMLNVKIYVLINQKEMLAPLSGKTLHFRKNCQVSYIFYILLFSIYLLKLFQLFCSFLLFFLLSLICKSTLQLVILNTSHLSNLCITNLLFHSVDCLFTSLQIFLDKLTFFILMKSLL